MYARDAPTSRHTCIPDLSARQTPKERYPLKNTHVNNTTYRTTKKKKIGEVLGDKSSYIDREKIYKRDIYQRLGKQIFLTIAYGISYNRQEWMCATTPLRHVLPKTSILIMAMDILLIWHWSTKILEGIKKKKWHW